jgi:hypothetical protein
MPMMQTICDFLSQTSQTRVASLSSLPSSSCCPLFAAYIEPKLESKNSIFKIHAMSQQLKQIAVGSPKNLRVMLTRVRCCEPVFRFSVKVYIELSARFLRQGQYCFSNHSEARTQFAQRKCRGTGFEVCSCRLSG